MFERSSLLLTDPALGLVIADVDALAARLTAQLDRLAGITPDPDLRSELTMTCAQLASLHTSIQALQEFMACWSS